jgi:DNA-binding HxlR family transcriptional regulator
MNLDCTIYKTMDFVGKRWTILILLEIYKSEENSKRYSEIKKSLPDITPKILSSRLKELEEHNLIKKTVDASTTPVRCDYSLTDQGVDFIGIVTKVKEWALKWKIKNNHCDIVNCKECPY